MLHYLKDGVPINVVIRNIVREQGYSDEVANRINDLFNYMAEISWIGACHATSSILFIALSELGCKPEPCIGEVFAPGFGYFDHSWLKVDGKIIDLACCATMQNGEAASAPIVFDVDLFSGKSPRIKYGIYYEGLGEIAKEISKKTIVSYMNDNANHKDGLWSVLETVYNAKYDIPAIKDKYKTAMWKLVVKQPKRR